MQTTAIGQIAEQVAVDYLLNQGYSVRARNWKHKRAEIDIVAVKDGRAHFIEVKYRQRSNSGSGMDYITPQKLRHMMLGCDLWLVYNVWYGPYCLGAIEVSGPHYHVTAFVPVIA